jgi:hypothetical protein
MRSVAAHSMLFKSRLQMGIIAIELVNRLFPVSSPPVSRNLVENFNLIISCFKVVLGTLLDLHCHVVAKFQIFG